MPKAPQTRVSYLLDLVKEVKKKYNETLPLYISAELLSLGIKNKSLETPSYDETVMPQDTTVSKTKSLLEIFNNCSLYSIVIINGIIIVDKPTTGRLKKHHELKHLTVDEKYWNNVWDHTTSTNDKSKWSDLKQLLKQPVSPPIMPQTLISFFLELRNNAKAELNKELKFYFPASLINEAIAENLLVQEPPKVYGEDEFEPIIIGGNYALMKREIAAFIQDHIDVSDYNVRFINDKIIVDGPTKEQIERRIELKLLENKRKLDKLLKTPIGQLEFDGTTDVTVLDCLLFLRKHIKETLEMELPLHIPTKLIPVDYKPNFTGLRIRTKERYIKENNKLDFKERFLPLIFPDLTIKQNLQYIADAANLEIFFEASYILIKAPHWNSEQSPTEDDELDDFDLDDSGGEDMYLDNESMEN